MTSTIQKIVDTFATVRIFVDGAFVDVAPNDADVEYWAVTVDGTVLWGVNRDGLDRVLAALGVIEEREFLRLQDQLDALADRAAELFELASLEIFASHDGIRFRIAGATLYGWKFVEFADVETLLAFDLSSNDKSYTG
ncbi:hypothetical protein CO662_32900 [Rhizobium anhuiense]|uniref:Uncharacterized protein n=1 Tax=Rhizobium anhuiense TaxID=1184720 RepID=A0ABX4IY52_9HYPH|nr:hypothetical protein [Rhizobium anhuiense]PDS40867.1 hypothetical protein CO668_32065 [Rhizobium anhuiense]PDS47839.1 hypothetical protein CO662_32900 [Rhizobium anhuiense]